MAEEGNGAKKRKPNWTTDECLYLSRLVEEKKEVLRAKFGAGVTTIKKREAWRHITDKINSTSSTLRTVEEVEKKWHNIQMKGKAELADARRSIKQTGGGPAGSQTTPLAEAVGNVIGTDSVSISGIPGAIDTTYLLLDADPHQTTSKSPQVTDFMITSTKESGDHCSTKTQELGLLAIPSCQRCLHITALQEKRMEHDVEHIRLQNELLKLQIKKLETELELSEK